MNKTIKKFFRKLTKRPKEIGEQPVDAKKDSKSIKKPQDVPKPIPPAPPITTQLVNVKKLYDKRMQQREAILSLTSHVQPCIQTGTLSGNLALVDDKNKEVINFDKQIGRESEYGIAYMVTALAENPLQISIKLMEITDEHRLESDLLNKMTNLVINQYTPNLPVTYRVLECTGEPTEIQPSKQSKVKPVALMHNKQYFLIMNELAAGDEMDYLKQAHTDMSYTSTLFQMIFAIQAFHQLGYSHNDAHPGNFLYHTNISQGGFWQYRYKDTIICIPNIGHLMVLWDPGFATPLQKNNENNDFSSIITHMYKIDKDNKEMGLVPINPKMNIYKLLDKCYKWLKSSESKDASFMDYLVDMIKHGEIDSYKNFILTNKDLPNLSTFPAPLNYLINKTPYPLEFMYDDENKYDTDIDTTPPVAPKLVDVKKLYDKRMQQRDTILSLTSQVQPCVKAGAFSGNLALVDDNNKEVINFDKQIGRQSVYGIAYMVTALAENPLQVSIKLMHISDEHRLEGDLLNKMTNLVINQYTPNLPVTYRVLECIGRLEIIKPSKHFKVKPPIHMDTKYYFLIMNELAAGDAADYFKQNHVNMSYISTLFQMIFAIQAFHQLGYSHNDAHLGNFLYHTNISQGGYWQYQYKDTIICVPNTGHLMVLWDPGLATPLHKNNENTDFKRMISLIYSIDKDDYFKAEEYIPIGEKKNVNTYNILKKFHDWLDYRIPPKKKGTSFMDYLVDMIKQGEINSSKHFILTNKDLPNLSTFPAPYNYIINEKPYPLEFTYTE